MIPLDKTEKIVSHEKEILLGFAITKKNLDGSIQVSLRWGRLLICLLLMFCISLLYQVLKLKNTESKNYLKLFKFNN